MFLFALLVTAALAETPADLDALVRLALERDPDAAAFELDARAAREDARSAGRPMNPMAMVGVDSLGAMPEDLDPTMYMFGVEQMLRGWGEARAAADVARVDVTRAEAERARVEADLRLRLAQSAARIRALQAERALLDEQIRAAETLWQAGVRRWGAGAGRAGMGGMGPGGGMEGGAGNDAPSTAPPSVRGGGGGGGGMAGMPGIGGGSGGTARPSVPASGMDGMGGSSGMDSGGMGAGGMASGSTLPDLLRVEAEVARLRAEAASVDARFGGELAVLARFVGEDGVAAVRANPGAFLGNGAPPSAPPEVDLAAAERAAADAELRLARSRIAPDLELRTSVGMMPDGMVQGVNVMVGVEVPLWGANARARDAATARAEAAARRADAVDRDLAAATDAARAAEAAAGARAKVLREVAVPRAEAAWKASLVRYAAGQATVDDALRAWEGLLAARQDLVGAEQDEALRAAERARVEVR